jgi:peroxiredoxin
MWKCLGWAKLKYLLAVFMVSMISVGEIPVRLGGQGLETSPLVKMHVRAPEFPRPSPIIPFSPSQPSPQQLPAAGPGSPQPSASRQPSFGTEPQQAAWPEVAWINSGPLAMSELRGKVVLIDFWEYTCINCIRTFAENKKWYERYHKDGFEIIGVHDPEFDIAYPVKNVKSAVERFGLPYPVVVDDWFRIWRAYHNSSWPNRFLIDAQGNIRYNRVGEGGNSAMEHAIQELLKEAHSGLIFAASEKIPAEEFAFAPSCGIPTPEMYVGYMHGRGILSNPQGYHKGKTLHYKLPPAVEDGHAAVSGRWETDDGRNPDQSNGMIYRGKKKGDGPSGDELEMRYHARELYAVMNVEHGHPSRIYVRQDGKDLTSRNKGVDIQFDSEGHSYIKVREPRMYYLVANPAFGRHKVELFPTRPGLTINSFTFGNNCQINFPHL